MEPYRVLVCIEILQLQKPSRRDRDLILRFLENLRSNPFGKGDYEERDEVEASNFVQDLVIAYQMNKQILKHLFG